MRTHMQLSEDFRKEEINNLISHIEWFISEVNFFRETPSEILEGLKEKTKKLYREL